MEGFFGSMIAVIVAKMVWDGSKSKLPPEQQKAANKRFIKFLGWLALFLVGSALVFDWIVPVHAQTTQHTFRDANGRTMGRSVTDTRGNTTFYNERGQNTGRSSTQNGTTTIYNERGQQTGRISK